MDEMIRNDPLVTVYVQVYNTKSEYLIHSISSILKQTYADFDLLIVDNGCTDGSTSSILQGFARDDERINLIRREKNEVRFLCEVLCAEAKGEYITSLDADDWWENDYLERMLQFIQENQLDIACTGTHMHILPTGEEDFRTIDKPCIFNKSQFAIGYPLYHVFFRPVWGKMFRKSIIEQVPQDVEYGGYGGDTFLNFQLLRRAERIGVDSSVLHHYLIHPSSISYQYDPKRFDSDVFLYQDAVDFLSQYGPISAQNQYAIYVVYANAISDTIEVISKARLSAFEKLKEYRRIAENPITKACYRSIGKVQANSRKTLVYQVLEEMELYLSQKESLYAVLATACPNCAEAITEELLPVISACGELKVALFDDDPDLMLKAILELICKRQYMDQCDFGKSLQALTKKNVVLQDIHDMQFIQNYMKLYSMVVEGENLSALDEMTGLLLEDQVVQSKETFLRMYLNLAAYLEEPSAYVFGNIRLAELFFQQNRTEECQKVLSNLVAMGAGENEDVQRLVQQLSLTSEDDKNTCNAI